MTVRGRAAAGGRGMIIQQLAVARHLVAAAEDDLGPRRRESEKTTRSRPPAGRDGAAVVQAVVLGGVERPEAEGGRPDRSLRPTAMRIRWSIEPSSRRSAGWRSSVQRQRWRSVTAEISGEERPQVARVGRLAEEDGEAGAQLRARLVDRGRTRGRCGCPPRHRRARARPVRPGQWPSRWRRRKASSLARTPGSPATTPGKFITSARPSTRGSASSAARSAASSRAPDGFESRGRHAGRGVDPMSSGARSASRSMKRMPWRPRTLPISCGSVTTVVTPRGTTARANSAGGTMELSIWTWASIRPGATKRPSRSITRSALRGPLGPLQLGPSQPGSSHPTTIPAATAMSAEWISPDMTLTRRALRNSRSTGSSPRAAARARGRSVIFGPCQVLRGRLRQDEQAAPLLADSQKQSRMAAGRWRRRL